MRTVKLRELSGIGDVQISSLFAMKQRWEEEHTFVMRNPRKQSAFLWFYGAAGLFCSEDGKRLAVPKGSLVYIPEGSVYTVTFTECTERVSTVLIELCLATDEERFVLAPEISLFEAAPIAPALCDLLLRMANAFAMPERPHLTLMSDLYRLLSLLASSSDKRRISRRGFSTIEAGIRYLQTDEKQELSIDEVAAMCFVSPAYFRRLFRKYAGVSPAEYRTARKIERACELLSTSSLSVAAIAELLGYDTPSYFCRVFRERTGLSPAAYARKASIEK